MRHLEDGEVRAWVELWSACRAWATLPRLGGLDDQPALDMAALRVCDQAAAEYRTWRRSPREFTGQESVAHLRQMMRVMGGKDRTGR